MRTSFLKAPEMTGPAGVVQLPEGWEVPGVPAGTGMVVCPPGAVVPGQFTPNVVIGVGNERPPDPTTGHVVARDDVTLADGSRRSSFLQIAAYENESVVQVGAVVDRFDQAAFLVVVCSAPQSRWSELSAAFDAIVASAGFETVAKVGSGSHG